MTAAGMLLPIEAGYVGKLLTSCSISFFPFPIHLLLSFLRDVYLLAMLQPVPLNFIAGNSDKKMYFSSHGFNFSFLVNTSIH